jgi:hypothetical protein
MAHQIDPFCVPQLADVDCREADHNGGSARVLQNFSITQCDAVCMLAGIRRSRAVTVRSERQGARPGGVRAFIQGRPGRL